VTTRRAIGFALAVPVLACLGPARAAAQTAPQPPPNVSWARDGAITIAAVAGAGLARLIPVDTTAVWTRQLLPVDRGLEGRLSVSASDQSDVIAAVDVVVPAALLVGQEGALDGTSGRRLLVYGETLAVSLLLNNATKYLVGRPRPYVYSDDPRVRAYAERAGKDSRLSFYSGHASTTFAASVAGSYLLAQAATDAHARAAVWGFEIALASCATRLRTRAGKHFYSDVLVGLVVGSAVGYAVPRLHGGPSYRPSGTEWAAIGLAPVVGVAVAQLLPARPDVLEPLGTVALPYLVPGGGGVMLARAF